MKDPREPDDLDDESEDALDAVWDLGLKDAFGGEAERESPGDPEPGDRCGRYILAEEIAQGGMGKIFRARDDRLERDVAVKVLRARLREDDVMTSRFLEEARIAADLQHPGIVPVYDMGLDEEARPWFSMKLVEGRTLAELLKERDDPRGELSRFLSIFATVCQAVAVAHERGVIHRDLKPANVMIGPFGEVQVLDWGFAKILHAITVERPSRTGGAESKSESDSSRSVSGSVLGTPRYMSPEQARGEIENLDARADVFGLGAMLCEILTGETPWGRISNESPLDRARRGDLAIAEAALDACDADAELVELSRRCLAVDRKTRPKNAAAVAAELERYLAAAEDRTRRARVEAASARELAAHERRTKSLTLALTAVLVVLLAGGGWWWREREIDRRQRFQAGLERIDGAIRDARAEANRGSFDVALGILEQADRGLDREDAPELGERLHATRQLIVARRERKAVGIAELERRRTFEARLLEIRLSDMDEPGSGTEDYAAAFREFGHDLPGQRAELAYLEISKHPQDLRESIRIALDDWASRERAGEGRRPPQRGPGGPDRRPIERRSDDLLRLAQFLDDDPWRRALRAAVLDENVAELERIADEAIREGASAKDATLLATTLHRAGKAETAFEVVRAAFSREPDDALLNHHIALFATSPERGRELVERDRALALRHAAIAMALSPESPFLRDHLIVCLLDGGEVRQAVDLSARLTGLELARIARRAPATRARDFLHQLTCERPDLPEAHALLIDLRGYLGDLEGAAAETKVALERHPDATSVLAAALRHEIDLGRLGEARRLLEGIDEVAVLRRLERQLRRRVREQAGSSPNSRFPASVRARIASRRGETARAREAYIEVLNGDDRGAPSLLRPPLRDAIIALLGMALEDGEQRAQLLELVVDEIELRLDEVELGGPEAAIGLEDLLVDERLVLIEPELFDLLGAESRELWQKLRARLERLPRRRRAPPGNEGRFPTDGQDHERLPRPPGREPGPPR